MRAFFPARTVLLALLFATALGLSAVPARAAGPTPQQIQTLITTGHPGRALVELRGALRDHPHSGVAWYLKAEAEDATGHVAAAREALSRAETYAPGLPFADAARVAALRAHLAAAPQTGLRRVLTHPATLVLGGLVILFLLMRWVGRNRRMSMQPPYPNNFGYGPNGSPPGTPPSPYGPGGGFAGGGLGGSILTGLAAGAGFAAGERIIDGLAGGQNGPMVDPNGGDPGIPPDRDDGLTGNPGWDDGTGFGDGGGDGGGGDFDPDNNW